MCTQKAQKYHTSGTKIVNCCAFCVSHVCVVCVPDVCAQCVHTLGSATQFKIEHLRFPTPCRDCSNSSWLFLKRQQKFYQKLKSDEPALNDVFKDLIFFLVGDINYFWKSRFWIFQDSYNFAYATPKWRDGVIVAEISEISSEIQDLNFRWESRICDSKVNPNS